MLTPLIGLFVIDPTGIVRQITLNDDQIGRSIDEVLRLLKGLQVRSFMFEFLRFPLSFILSFSTRIRMVWYALRTGSQVRSLII